ncbi:protein SpAN-like [Saccoglossus kowalevskii]|uniref:Metalloendopeptidase n=1 Tax=Saccoglossus kowalevskii TaxID=10224 RepID=A0ABM0MNA0_SACKO|nr:PREDICTED: protein SpAN-like [Saccoglossus kowalevskii]
MSTLVKDDPSSVEAAETSGAIEGDMMMDPAQKQFYSNHLTDLNLHHSTEEEMKVKRKAINTDRYKVWPNGIIPYVFDTLEPDMIYYARSAMEQWESNTCIRFVTYPTLDVNHDGRIEFVAGNGCWANVAFTGNAQKISLQKGTCNSIGVALHELGHTLGLFHEQSRPDRDEYIAVHIEHVQHGKEGNFKKRDFTEASTLDVPYDVSSVMHYGPKSFSKDGNETIESLDPEKQSTMGKQRQLTFLDRKIMNELYRCSDNCTNRLECLYGGYMDRHCQCVCPNGFSGVTCNDVVSRSDCGEKLTSSSGTITSPNYPDDYDDNVQCSWFIQAPDDYRVSITFDDFLLEFSEPCEFDRLEIRYDEPYYDGYPRSACGTDLYGVTLESSHNSIFLNFTSDYSVGMPGFSATYHFIPTT